jgi:hypothetical protein
MAHALVYHSMSSDEQSLCSVLALEQVRKEITFIRDELDAFKEFECHVEDISCLIDTSQQEPPHSSFVFQRRSQTHPAQRLKQGYKSTVMSTPHYESEYGDSYQESIRAEFDAGAIQILIGGVSYTPLAKERIIEAVARAREDRSAYLDGLHEEESDLRSALFRLENWLDEIDSIEERLSSEENSNTSYISMVISDIRVECDELASRRQETVNQRQQTHRGTSRPTRIMHFVYYPEPFENPILSDIGFVGNRLENVQKRFQARIS